MSETPKEKKTVRKPVNEHASSYDKPAKKTNPAPKKAVPAKPAKKTTTAKVEDQEVVETVVEAVQPPVTEAQLESVLEDVPNRWVRFKKFLGL